MPELPEVEVILQHLKPHVIGGTIESFMIHRSDIVRRGQQIIPWLSGSKITDLYRRGKCIIFSCTKLGMTQSILSELGMTGLWFFQSNFASSPQHVHAQMTLSNAHVGELHYWNPRRFGRLWLFEPSELEMFMQRRFGPEALDIGEGQFIQLLQACRGQLKPFFLDQHRLAGLGNIYANEILFRARIHPHAQCHQLRTQSCRRLYHTMRDVLQEALAKGGSSVRDFLAPNGYPGNFQKCHQVYQKEGFPCPHGCPTVIKRIQSDRSSFLCPKCQKKR